MYEFENFLMENLVDNDNTITDTDESYIDATDDMSILEAMVDQEIEEACKKEACKKEGKDVCEKCGKPVGKCECARKTSVKETDDDLLDDDDF